MKAKIISWRTGTISDEEYDVLEKSKDKNVLIVGENYNGKPIIMSYEDSEVLFLD